MGIQNESESVAYYRDRDMRARVILDVGMNRPHQFSRNGRTFPASTAFQSQVLVRDLLKLGLFAMNIPSMAELEDDRGDVPVTFSRVPASLLGIGIHYAIDVAPNDTQEIDGRPVVLLDELERHVQQIETHFGRIDVDMGLVAMVAQCAREASMSPDMSAREV